MTNLQRGELELVVDGKTYTLVLDINALCLLEAKHSTPQKKASFVDLLNGVAEGTVSSIREVVWAALQTHHKGMSEEDAGRLIQACGGMLGFAKQLGALVDTVSPDGRDAQELGADRPLQAQAEARGTGATSTSTLARSA